MASKKGVQPIQEMGNQGEALVATDVTKIEIVDTKQDSRDLNQAYKLAIAEVIAVLQRERPITDVTRIAANTISNYSRIKSTEIHDKALEIMMQRKSIQGIES